MRYQYRIEGGDWTDCSEEDYNLFINDIGYEVRSFTNSEYAKFTTGFTGDV